MALSNFSGYLILFLLLGIWIRAHKCDTVPSQLRRLWNCDGCDSISSDDIYDQINRAARYGDRLSYLALDMAWWDQIPQSNSTVHVRLLPFSKIFDLGEAETAGFIHPTNSDIERDTFHITAFHKCAEFNETELHKYAAYRHGVDTFLTLNPCWIPLREPPSKIFFDEEEFLLFIRLPEFGYHVTCQLFTSIVNRQFPTTCTYDQHHLATYQLPNIGFGHILSFTANAMLNGLLVRPAKVFTAPFSELFLSRINLTFGSNVSENPRLWAWADPKLCSQRTFNNDPWACNYIPFTNCSNRALSQHLKPIAKIGWVRADNLFVEPDAPSFFSSEIRTIYQDSSALSNGIWLQTRIYAFLQRPNSQLRRKLYRSLRAVRRLSRSTQRVSKGVVRLPSCIAIHIRHNDATLDRRSVARYDRSLSAHVAYARNLSTALGGIQHIFLATDNATIAEVARKHHKDFKWYTQRRPLSKSVNPYKMFTEPSVSFGNRVIKGHDTFPDDFNRRNVEDEDLSQKSKTSISSAEGGGGGGGEGGLMQYSTQTDLSHVMADWRFASQCSALVGSMDSRFTYQTRSTMCAVNKDGVCPDMINIVDGNFLPSATEMFY